MTDPSDRQAGRAEGERRRDAMTSLVRRRRPVASRCIQRALLSRLMDVGRASTDDIRDGVAVPPDTTPSIWGAAVQGLTRARPPLIRSVGRVVSSRPERHGCEIREWELAADHAAVLSWLATHGEPEPDDETTADPVPAEPAAMSQMTMW